MNGHGWERFLNILLAAFHNPANLRAPPSGGMLKAAVEVMIQFAGNEKSKIPVDDQSHSARIAIPQRKTGSLKKANSS